MCKELKEAMESTTDDSIAITDELIKVTSQFAQTHHLLSSGETKLQSIFPNDVTHFFQKLKDNENMFVSPGDLLNNCKNLKTVGTID